MITVPVTPTKPAAELTVQEVLDLFERFHVSRLKSPASFRCLLRRHFAALAEKRFATLTRLDILNWSNEIRQRIGEKRADAAIKALRCVYNRAIEWDLYSGENMAARVKIARRSKRSVYIRDDQEMQQVLNVILAAGYPERLFFYAMLVLAPRPKELRTMRLADVRVWQEAGTWHGLWTKPTTKTGQPHTVPIPSKLAEMFHFWLNVRPLGSEWLFPGQDSDAAPLSKETWQHYWQDLRTKAGLPGLWCYDLRRSGATWATEESGNLAAVSRGMLGHSNFQETTRYVQVMDRNVKQVIASHESRLLRCAGEHATAARSMPDSPAQRAIGPSHEPTPRVEPAPMVSPALPQLRGVERAGMEWPG